MNLIQRFRARTPERNKRIGRLISAITGVISVVETTLYAYQDKFPLPHWVHVLFMSSAVIGALWAAYHGAQVKK